MAEEPAQRPFDVEQLVAELKERVERERAAGAYADDLSGIELQLPPQVEDASGPRVRFRPELGFSSKPVIGPVITLVKRLILRLQFYVLDDLARQADKAIATSRPGSPPRSRRVSGWRARWKRRFGSWRTRSGSSKAGAEANAS